MTSDLEWLQAAGRNLYTAAVTLAGAAASFSLDDRTERIVLAVIHALAAVAVALAARRVQQKPRRRRK